MKGTILDFSIQSNNGVISGEDQQRYNFTGAQWRAQRPPRAGDQVDFEANQNQALNIYLVQTTQGSPFDQISQHLDRISNQNQAEENYNPIDWFVKCLKNYANFEGRARRKEFWFFSLCQFVILVAAQLMDAMLGTGILFYAIFVLALFLPGLAAGIRRLHDVDKSGWWMLISLVPLVGFIVLIVFWATPTKPQRNEWGDPAM